MYSNVDVDFCSNLISRHTTFLSGIPSAAQMIYLQPVAQNAPLTQTTIYQNQVTDIYNLSRCIQSNTLVNVSCDLHFLNRIFAQALQTAEKTIFQKQFMLEKQVSLLQQKSIVTLERTKTKALFVQAAQRAAGRQPLLQHTEKNAAAAQMTEMPVQLIPAALSREIVSHILERQAQNRQWPLASPREANALPAQVVYRQEPQALLPQERQTLLAQLAKESKATAAEHRAPPAKNRQPAAQTIVQPALLPAEQTVRQAEKPLPVSQHKNPANAAQPVQMQHPAQAQQKTQTQQPAQTQRPVQPKQAAHPQAQRPANAARLVQPQPVQPQQSAQPQKFAPTPTVHLRPEQAKEASAQPAQQTETFTPAQRKLAAQQKILQQAVAAQRQRREAAERSIARPQNTSAPQAPRFPAQPLQANVILQQTRTLQKEIRTQMQRVLIKEQPQSDPLSPHAAPGQTPVSAAQTTLAPSLALPAQAAAGQPLPAPHPALSHPAKIEPLPLAAQQQNQRAPSAPPAAPQAAQQTPQNAPQAGAPAPMRHSPQAAQTAQPPQGPKSQLPPQGQPLAQQLFHRAQLLPAFSAQEAQAVLPAPAALLAAPPLPQLGTRREHAIESTPRLLRQTQQPAAQNAQPSGEADDIVTIRRRKTIVQEQHETQTQNIAVNQPEIALGKPEAAPLVAKAAAFSEQEIHRLTDQVYKAIENRLRSERIRRGTI